MCGGLGTERGSFKQEECLQGQGRNHGRRLRDDNGEHSLTAQTFHNPLKPH